MTKHKKKEFWAVIDKDGLIAEAFYGGGYYLCITADKEQALRWCVKSEGDRLMKVKI